MLSKPNAPIVTDAQKPRRPLSTWRLSKAKLLRVMSYLKGFRLRARNGRTCRKSESSYTNALEGVIPNGPPAPADPVGCRSGELSGRRAHGPAGVAQRERG